MHKSSLFAEHDALSKYTRLGDPLIEALRAH